MKRSELKEIIKSVVSESLKGYTKDSKTGKLTSPKGTMEAYKGDPDRGNAILDKANVSNVDRISKGEQKYIVSFRVGEEGDDDVMVMATSPEDAISKLKSGEVKLAFGQPLPRLARSFSAKVSK
tara:strand:+ start:271 stop:642 length:372 start_codon:yes stop_codon:yes gene_type:complete